MRRSIDNSLAIGKEKPAGRSPLAAVQQLRIATVDIHAEDLIALIGRTSRLKDDFIAVEREIRLGVLTAERELSHVN
jgi:hypothetical protein